MTTAHRPTYNSAVGGSEQGGNKILVPSRQYSAKDLPGQLSMKDRPPEDFGKKDYKQELLEKENAYQLLKNVMSGKVGKEQLDIKEVKDIKEIKPEDQKENKEKYVNPFPQDADDENFKNDSSENESDDSSEEESENELLMKEFEKIKKQKEEEQKKKIREKQDEIEQKRQESLLKGNPLLDTESYSLKRRWYEDTVFKNQTRTEPKEKKRFINDTVRSSFHKKFLNKYILN